MRSIAENREFVKPAVIQGVERKNEKRRFFEDCRNAQSGALLMKVCEVACPVHYAGPLLKGHKGRALERATLLLDQNQLGRYSFDNQLSTS